MANSVRIRAVLDDKVSSGLDKIRDRFDRLGKSKGAASVLQGVGVGIGVSAYGMLTSAIGGVVSIMGDATRAAMEDEASQARLGAALAANIPAWKGNTTAIERVLTARIKLGFSDDEQRDSLARLVVATKDETKALAVQRTAMDLARLKKISLSDATDALVKVEGGQFRALKALGIQLPKNATATEALAAVQKAARGQAEAYAKTNEGKLLASQVRLDEAMEKLGTKTMPILADAAVAVADAVESIIAAAEDLPDIGPIWDLALSQMTAGASKSLEYANAQRKLADEAIEAANAVDQGRHSTSRAAATFTLAAGSAEKMAAAFDETAKASAAAFNTMVDSLVSDANRAIGEAFDPLTTQYELVALNAQVASDKRALAAGSATAAEKLALAESQRSVATHLVDLAAAGQTNSKAYKDGLADLRKNIASSSGTAKAALQSVLDKILAVERAGAKVPIRIQVYGPNGALLNIPIGTKAAGGPVTAKMPYLVGEKGPELFVPSGSGTIIPNGASGGSTFAGGGLTVNFNSIWPPTRAQAQDIARMLDEAQYSAVQYAAPTAGRV